MHTTSKDPPMETKSAKEIVFYFFCSWFSQIQKFPAEGPEILSQKRWSKSYAWKWISETVLKSWRRLPEIVIFFVFELPVLPTSGIFGDFWCARELSKFLDMVFQIFLGKLNSGLPKFPFFGPQNVIFLCYFLIIFGSFFGASKQLSAPSWGLENHVFVGKKSSHLKPRWGLPIRLV